MAPQIVPKRRKTLMQILQVEAKQFCLNTALHGYKFIVLPRRSWLERIIWGLICLVSLVTAVTLLCMAWFNFQENPTALVTDSTNYPVWNYDFPAVTICDYNIISKRRTIILATHLYSTVKNRETARTPEQLALDLRLLIQLVNYNNPNIPKENYTRVDNLLKENQLSVYKALESMAPTCEDMLLKCKWKGEYRRCKSLFEPVLTSEGFCCSFNYFALKNHIFYGTSSSKAPKMPRRVSACGHQTALEVLVNGDVDDYFATHIPSFGFRVFIHNSYSFLDWSLQSILLETNTLNLVNVNPTLTYATENIKQMPIKTRQCLFSNEKTLINFNQYNFHNCMVECRMNLTIQLCGCKPYYYIYGKDTHRNICTVHDIPCLVKNEAVLASSIPGFNFSNREDNQEFGTERSSCDCLPDCEITDYLSEYSSGDLNVGYLTKQTVMFNGVTISNQSLLKVFFNDLVATRNRRDVIFTWHTLLAFYGGILGLFTGFSFVSGMEIIYFFVIRLLGNISRNNKTVNYKLNKISVHHSSEVNIQSKTFESLDASKLMIPSYKGVRNRSIHTFVK